MDNASSLGAGGAVVAQNDQDLGAEWALSNFDQRHSRVRRSHLGAAVRRRPEVARERRVHGGDRGRVVDEHDVHRALRLAVHGARRQRDEQRRQRHERVAAGRTTAARPSRDPIRRCWRSSTRPRFRRRGSALFGTSPRNFIIGPGGHVVNASFSRDMRIGGNRAVTLVSQRQQPVQHDSVDGDRHEHQLADVRLGHALCAACGRSRST